jgi:hypothetical protein
MLGEARPLSLTLPSDKRSQEQESLARRIGSSDGVRFVGIDPGGGKTSIALMTHSFSQCGKLIVALPKVALVDSLAESMAGDLGRMGSTEHIQVLHSGATQDGKDIYDAGIVLTTFDRLLSPTYRRQQFDEMFIGLCSTVVIDEFQDLMLQERMLFPARVYLTMRNMLSGCRTLLLSGTPNPALMGFLVNSTPMVFGRGELKFAGHRGDDSCDVRVENSSRWGTGEASRLVFLNPIDGVIAEKRQTKDAVVAHSKMTREDKELSIRKLKTGVATKIIASHLVTSSLDFSVSDMWLQISLPEVNCQTLGRRNRHGKHGGGVVTFAPLSDDDGKFFHTYGFSTIVEKWEEFLSKNAHGRRMNHRETMVNLYDVFVNDSEIKKAYSKEIAKRAAEGIKAISGYFPKKTEHKGSQHKQGGASNFSFRDGGDTVLAWCPSTGKYVKLVTALWGDAGGEVLRTMKRNAKTLKRVLVGNVDGVDNGTFHERMGAAGYPGRPYVLSLEDKFSKYNDAMKEVCKMYVPGVGLVVPEDVDNF